MRSYSTAHDESRECVEQHLGRRGHKERNQEKVAKLCERQLLYLWADLCCQYKRWHEGDPAQACQQDRVNQHKGLVINPQPSVHTCRFDKSLQDLAPICKREAMKAL